MRQIAPIFKREFLGYFRSPVAYVFLIVFLFASVGLAFFAGGFFKGIDALPITGQYTHYALDKKTGKPDYVTDSAASGTAWGSSCARSIRWCWRFRSRTRSSG